LLTTGAINLNCTKYRTKRVHSALPNDLSSVFSILGLDPQVVLNKSFIRLIAYTTGCSARNVQRFMNDNDESSVAVSASPENSLTGNNTMSNHNIILLRRKVLKALRQKNKDLLGQICENVKNTHDIWLGIVTIEWENILQPISYEMVEKIWANLVRRKKILSPATADLHYYVLHLADRGWIAIDGVRDSKVSRIYPCSMESLVNSKISEEYANTIKEHITNSVELPILEWLFPIPVFSVQRLRSPVRY
jgi:hypothetical protein